MSLLILPVRYWLVLYWLTVTALFLWPNPSQQQHLPVIPHIDKLAHTLVYLLLALLIIRANKHKNHYLLWLSIAVVYGIGIEAIQHVLPGRFFSVADVMANCFGLILGYFLIRSDTRQ